MAISLKHLFQSAKTDGPDNTIVQPSDWNDEHVLTQATGKLLGRTTAGTGATEEIAPGTGITLSAGTLSADVTSVAGRTGAVTLSTADISGLTTGYVQKTSATGSAYLPAGTTGQREGSPSAGYIRYNTTTGKFEGYGSAWGNIGGGAAIGDTPPANPGAGDLWWNSADGRMYVYYTDANSSQWVDLSAGGAGQYLPLTGGTVTGNVTVTGSFGVGTASPQARVHLSTGATDEVARFEGTGSPYISLYRSGEREAYLFSAPSAVGLWGDTNKPLVLATNNTARMQIDASGRVTMPYQPAFTAVGGGTVSYSTSNTVIALAGTVTNRGGHYNTSSYRFTAPVAGVYVFAHRATWGGNGTGVAVYLAVNGNSVGGASSYTEIFGYTSAGGYNTTSAGVTVVSLNANDYVDLRTNAYNSATQSIDLTRTSLTGYLIG